MYRLHPSKSSDGLRLNGDHHFGNGILNGTAGVNILGLPEEWDIGTYAYCRFSNGWLAYSAPIHPDNLVVGKNILYLQGEKEYGPSRYKPIFRMIEHVGGLPVLLQTPLILSFHNNESPYNSPDLERITWNLMRRREPAANRHKTIKRYMIWRDPDDPKKFVEFNPTRDKRLTITGHFDYTKSRFSCLGKVDEYLDTWADNLPYFSGSRSVSMHPIYNFISRFFDKWTHEESIIRKPSVWDAPEQARHKIYDLLVYLNLGDFFLSSDIVISKVGHMEHALAMEKFLREAELVDLV